jgi:hypothetical protein
MGPAAGIALPCTCSSSSLQPWANFSTRQAGSSIPSRVGPSSYGSSKIARNSPNPPESQFGRRIRVTVMRFGGGPQDKKSGGEGDSPETLFMKELAKRKKLGPTPMETKTKESSEDDSETTNKKKSEPKWTDEREKSDQRQRSMALNSEGLDGLVPRGQELVKLGASFWLSFWPLIAASLVAFVASYLYFGSAFLHSGNRLPPPPYVDPFQLLESEELPPQVGPNRVPFNTYTAPQQ